MGLLSEVKEEFGANGLYELLEVAKGCSESQLNKAYKKAARKYHPDKAQEAEKETATRRFQILSRAHAVLASKDARKLYDTTGEVDDEAVSGASFSDWTDYWRRLFPQVTSDKLEKFKKNYSGSEEELEDLRKGYLEHEGDMNLVLESVMLANAVDDEERLCNVIDGWIEAEEVPAFEAYTKEKAKDKKKRRDKASREAAEADELRREIEGQQQPAAGGSTDLASMILARRQQRGSFFDQFEARYAQKARKKVAKGKASPSELVEPSEEEFLAVQARIDARRASTKRGAQPDKAAGKGAKKGKTKRK